MELKSCRTARKVRETLRTLPKTLEENYERIFRSIPQQDQRYVRAALQWIACSARPLTIDELAVAAVIDPEVEESCKPEKQLCGGGEAIHEMLSKLIDVEKLEPFSIQDLLYNKVEHESFEEVLDYLARGKNPLTNPRFNPSLTVVKFSHSSVRDYVLRQQDEPIPSSCFFFSMDMANRFIARSCLAYVQDLSSAKFPGLMMYLARHWHVHAARLPNEEPASLTRLFNEVPIAQYLLMKAEDEYTGEDLNDIVGWDAAQNTPPSPEQQLRYAACCGSYDTINSVLQSNPHLDIDSGSALSMACERGYLQAVRTLLKAGADPNKYEDAASPLYLASRNGFDSIVRELIGHEAQIDVQSDDDDDSTPLMAAIIFCDPSIVKYLLVNGANPDFSTEERPISVAVACAKYECIIFLLEHGASLKGLGPSLLVLASKSGSARVVKLLLERGLDVNQEDFLKADCDDRISLDNRYALEYPTIKYWPPARGCSYTLYNYGSAMHAAAAFGHTEVIKVLIKNNAAINIKSHYWETPSTLASVKGHKEALEYLLENGGSAADLTDACYRRDIFQPFNDRDGMYFKLREDYVDDEDDKDDKDHKNDKDDGDDKDCEDDKNDEHNNDNGDIGRFEVYRRRRSI